MACEPPSALGYPALRAITAIPDYGVTGLGPVGYVALQVIDSILESTHA